MFADFDIGQLAMAPLTPNPSAVYALSAAVRTLEHPLPRPIPPPPDMAQVISGKTFSLSSETRTPLIKFISFDFSRVDDYSLSIDSGTTSRRLSLGLDGRFRITPTGEFGPLPGENKIASRGRWINANALELELLWVGEPLHSKLILSFESDRVVIKRQVYPAGLELNLVGTPSERKIAEPAT